MSDRRGLAALALCFLAALGAGCAQEGKLIDVPLGANAVAYDQVSVLDTDTATVTFTGRFKVRVHASNPCEARHVLLEISRTGPTVNPTYVIRPVARYNADDACTNLPPGASDTTVTLTVTGFAIANPGSALIEVKNAGGPSFAFAADSSMHSPVPANIRFRIKVEDKLSTSAVLGATVALDSLTVGGGVAPITSGLTDGSGLVTFDVASTVASGENAIRYQVTVTSGLNTVVMPVRAAPARGQSIERVFVRI